ncbi:MAG: DUF11 domain-containing protein [Chloroflexi bacterium]|nr:DUF11 domain-containing protein [Chloroflexota bacterium]
MRIADVNHAATGTATGLSWADAYTGLQDALTAAGGGDEIWVATGTYTPGGAAEATFRLLDDIEIYGGFVGTETVRVQRDWTLNVTVLSGDIDGNDVTTANKIVTDTTHITGTNARHVVTGAWVSSTAVLDGFTITAGKADDGAGAFDNSGGGMYNTSGSPQLANVTFSGNQASNFGGGMYNGTNSTPSLTNVTFSGNQTVWHGGGMFNNESSTPSLTNVTFSGNQADQNGGGMYNNDSSTPSLTNVTFSGNRANSYGGGMYNYDNSDPTLTNCILWGNTASISGTQMYNSSSTPVINYSLIAGGCPAGATCDEHFLTQDPRFVAPLSATAAPTTTGDYRLQDDSPAIDAGDNTALPPDTHDLDGDGNTTEPLPYDLDRTPRFVDHPQADSGNGTPPLVDLGAYETPWLWIAKTVTPRVLDVGERLTYTLSFSNHTSLTATNVLITDVVPSNWISAITVISSGVTITDTGASPAYVWQVQDLSPGEGGTITITGVLGPNVGRGQTVSNTMYAHAVFSGTSDVMTASAPVSRYGADLTLSKRVNDSQPYAGDTITYTLSVANLGPDDTTGVEIDDTLPPGVTYDSSYPTRGYIVGNSAWHIDTLRAGESATLDLVARVDVPAPNRNHITNTAVISASDQPDDLTGNNTASAVIELAHADLALTKTGPLDPVLPGTRLTYTLAITNQGTITTAGVILTDTLPIGVSFVATSPECSHTSSTITCTIGNLASLATRTFTVVTTPETGALITNTALVTGDEPDHDLLNNTATEPTWVSAEADLDVDKWDSVDPVLAGATLTWTLVVTNHGPHAAGGVVLTDVLPSGVLFAGPVLSLPLDEDAGAAQFEDDSGFGHHATCITCPTAGVNGRYGQAVQFDGVDDYILMPDLPGHDELSVEMWVNVTALPLTGTIASLIHHDGWNSAGQIHMHLQTGGRLQFTVHSNDPGDYVSTAAFGTDIALDQWVHLAYVYDVGNKTFALYINGQLDMQGPYTTAYPGMLGPGRIGSWNPLPDLPGWHERWFNGKMDEVVIYNRALSNLEVANLYQNSLDDPQLVASQGICTFPSDGAELACDLGTMAPGAVATITLPVRVNSALAENSILTNIVGVSGYVTDSVPFNDTAVETTTVQVQADLSLAKVADPDPGLVETPVTYTVSITNYGPSDAHNVLLTDTLHGAVTWGLIATSQGTCSAESGGTFTCTLGTMKGGGLAQVTLVITPAMAGTLTNTVRITGDEPDPISSRNAVTRTIRIGEIDLALSKMANANRLYEGEAVTYTITLTNHGPRAATSAVVSDVLPSGISLGAHITTHGTYYTYTSDTGVWNVGALAVDEVATLTITGTVDPGTIAQTLTNTAILSASQPVDIVTHNNTASAAITVIDDDLSINKTVDNPTAKPGDAITYTITFSNVGNSIATGVIITDSLPVSMTNASFSSNGVQITATSTISYAWDVEDLSVGQWGVITITGVLSYGLPASPFTNTATITTALPDNDPTNNSVSAGVTVENVAPVLATIGNRTVADGNTLSFTAVATDDNDDTLAFSLLDALSGADIGSSSGTFNWTPTEAQGPGIYTLTVVVSDTVITDSERIAITVNEVNQDPVLNAIGNQTVDEGTALTFSASATDGDLPVQILSYSLLDAPIGATIGSSNGVFSWTPTESQGPGTHTLTVVVSDTVITDSERIAITVNEVNQAPVLNAIGNQTVDEGTVLTFTASAADSDLPGQTLSYSLLDAPGGAVITSSNGAFSWMPTEAQGPGTYTLTVAVSDTVITDSERIAITVYEVNQAPILNAIGNQTVDEETELTFTASATDGDLPEQPLSYSLLDAPAGVTIGSFSGVFSWMPTEAQGPSTYTLTVVVSDTVITDSERIAITVNEVNKAPTISNILNQSTDPGMTVGPLPFTVGDAETDAASLSISTASSNQGLLPDSNIALGGSGANRTLFLAPATGLTGTATITVTVGDGTPFPNGPLTTYDTFVLAVGVNTPPEFTSTPVTMATVGILYTYAVTVHDADPGDTLTITAPISATWLNLTQTTSRTVTLCGTPVVEGDYPVDLQVSDGEDIAAQAFVIHVSAGAGGDEYYIYLPLILRNH